MAGGAAEIHPGAWGLAWSAIGAAVCAAMAPLEPSFLEEGMMLHVGEQVSSCLHGSLRVMTRARGR
jgi:hypothetical protein